MNVLVVGAGRSGTSALTGALEAMGLFVGPPEKLVPPSPQNPDGFFELEEVAGLNEELLSFLGGSWDGPPVLAEDWLTDPGIAPFLGRAQDLVLSLFGQRPFVLKDPRFSLLLPFWRRVLLDRFCVILVVRDPVAVAWSLSLSFGWQAVTGMALWSSYNRAALDGLSGLPVHVCSYDELVDSPIEVVTAIVTSLRDWAAIPDDADFDAAVAHIKPGLRRDTWTRNQEEFLNPPTEIRSLATAMSGMKGRHDSFEPGALPDPGPWQRALIEERRSSGVRMRASIGVTESLQRERDILEKDCEALQKETESLKREMSGMRADAVEVKRHLDSSRAEAALLGTDVEITRAELGVIKESRTFRYTETLRTIYAAARQHLGLD